MSAVTLRCTYCGARATIQLNEMQQHALNQQNSIERFCNDCLATTSWQPVLSSSAGPLRAVPGDTGPHVLLIDDDEDILKVVGKALSSFNWDVETAASARDAAMLLTRTDYDVIISDIRMPNFDGTQLFEFLDRHLPEYKAKVIFLTGDTGTASTMEFLQHTGAPYLSKPVDLNALVELVRKVRNAAVS